MAYDYDDTPIHCATCGVEMEPSSRFCANCGAVTASQANRGPVYAPGMLHAGGLGYGAPANVPNYLVGAILATICCCLPAGIVAIVYAAQVNGKLAAGDYTGAVRYSNNAKIWCWVSFGLGIAWFVLLGISGFMGSLTTFMW